jgi:5-hydroxyisourate hydrolase-like protein (transthyretin family)
VVEALTANVSATAQDAGTSVVSVTFKGGVSDVVATLADGQYSGQVTFAEAGAKTLEVFAVDASGNTSVKSVSLTVNTGGPPIVSLILLNSNSQPIQGQRVDLLRVNDSNTGIRQNTDSQGKVSFEVQPAAVHKLQVYHNGGSFITGAIVLGVPYEVRTIDSAVILHNSTGQPIADQRVDLLRSNDSNTGVRINTDGTGTAHFEVLPNYVHRFEIYHNGGAYKTDPAVSAGVGGNPIQTVVQTQASLLTFKDSHGQPINNQRIDLLRSNDSNTGVRLNTDSNGAVVFEILPGYGHKFQVYHNGGTFITDLISAVNQAGVTVATYESTLTLNHSGGGNSLAGIRVDLLRENESNTGIRAETNSQGVASFQVLPGYVHRFMVYHNGGSYVTAPVIPTP